MYNIFKTAVKAEILGKPVTPLVDTSAKYSFNKIDFVKVLIHTGVLAGTTALTFLGEYVSGVDAGTYTPIVILVVNAAVSAGLKFLKNNDVQP